MSTNTTTVGPLVVNNGPVDARTVVSTVSDLTTITQAYIGMRIFVKENNKEYKVTEVEGLFNTVKTATPLPYSEITQSYITSWNGKQNALSSTQLANIDKGGTALQPSSTQGLLKNDGSVDTETKGKAANAIQTPNTTEAGKIPVMTANGIEWQAKPSNGTTFIPSVTEAGVISWTNDGGETNPESVNIKGPKGNDAVNPFKGLFALDNNVPDVPSDITTNAVEGDYIYAPNSTDGTTTVVWKFDATNNDWDETTIDVSDVVGVEFANTSKSVAQTYVVNDLTTGGTTDVLSAEAGKNLRSNIFGGTITNTDSVELDDGKYWTTSINVGDTFDPSDALTTPSAANKYKYKHIVLDVGESCTAIHKAGTSNAFRRYVVTDSENEVLFVGGNEETIQTDTFTATSETGELNVYLNFYDTESTFEGQSLTKITHTIVGGALNEVKESLSYYNCSSAADADKVVICQNFVLSTKVRFLLKMQYANTKTNPTLKIGSSDAKSMYLNGVIVSDENTWAAGDVLDVYYDGTQYQCKSFSGSMSVEELKREIEGIPEEEVESITLEDGYFNTGSAVVGEEYVKDITIASISTFHAKKVVIKPGETYVAIHKGGASDSTKSYVKVDKNDKVLEIGVKNNDITTDTFTATNEEIKVYINFYASDGDFTGQSLTKYTTRYVGGALNAAKDELNGNMNVLRPLYGKTIVCLGDSLTEFVGNDGKTYSDHLAEMSGAIVINGGIGGAQIRQHAAITAFGGLDVISIVKAICSGSFPSTAEAGVMQYEGATAERTLENVTSVTTTEKTPTESVRYPDYTKIAVQVTINSEDYQFNLMVDSYELNGTTLTYTSDYAGYVTTDEWKTVIVAAENIAFATNPDDNRNIVRRLESVDFTKVDCFTVFAGTNDWNVGDDASTVGTSGTKNDETTLGAINKIIDLLSTTYPNIKLYWFTPIVRYANISSIADRDSEHWSDNLVQKGYTLKEFAALIANEVSLNHIPVCDMYNTLGWNTYNFSSFFNDNDSTHPRKGFKQIAERMYEFLVTRCNTWGADTLLREDVKTNTSNIATNTSNIATNAADISYIKEFLASKYQDFLSEE